MDIFTPAELKKLEEFTTSNSNIFCIKNMDPEVLSVLFAYISRSKNSIKRNILDFMEESQKLKTKKKTQKFHEKWVLKYGHSSVAEHSDIKIAIEKCSIVASKVIEDARLGSYTEKSTRYCNFSYTGFYVDEILEKSIVYDIYTNINNKLLDFYGKLIEKLSDVAEKRKVFDIARCVLPASMMTSIGISFNARVAEQAIVKLTSHYLPEIKRIGKDIKKQSKYICPTLIKYASQSSYRRLYQHRMQTYAEKHLKPPPRAPMGIEYPEVKSVMYLSGWPFMATSALYQDSHMDFDSLFHTCMNMKMEEEENKENLIKLMLDGRGEKEPPPRWLEMINILSEFIVDFGAYRDIQRHRICTQFPQKINTDLGYICPVEIYQVGMDMEYIELMNDARKAFHEIKAYLPGYEEYVVPMSFRRRVLFLWNLREVFHFIELRSRKTGHESYRKLAQGLWDKLSVQLPEIMNFCRVVLD